MSLETLISTIYTSFQNSAAGARLVLLHASSRYRTALVSRMLADPDVRVFYYAMGADDIDIPAFLAGFTHDLADQSPTFGASINLVPLDNLEDLTPLLDAFAQDLNQLSQEPYVLLLDEFDRANVGDDLQAFLEALVDRLPPQCCMVISSRTLPRFPWMSMIAQGKAVMLEDSDLIQDDFYQNQAKEDARVQVYGLG